jgi:beta-glucosidase
VRGFQGEDLAAPNTILACAKHFAAYGAAQAGRDYHTVDISEHTLWETYLPPFKACIDAGVATFMTSFNELFGVPASANQYLLKKVLRDTWHFEGFVVSDYTSINEMVNHGFAANNEDAAKLALNAGVDMDMQGAVYYDYAKDLLMNGRISEQTINTSVKRILQLKNKLGLFDDPYRYSNDQREKDIILSDQNKAAAREIARQSMVLLSNKKQTLPLKPTEKIALIGPLVDSPIDMLGSWHGSGQASDVITILKAFSEQSRNFQYAKGCDIESSDTTLFDQAILTAKNADKIVLVAGEHFNMSGEAASRAKIRIPDVQEKLLKRLIALKKPIIMVLINGRPLCLSWENEHVDAILEAWQPGTMAGPAIRDVLYGDHNPSGKLPVTFPIDEGQIPIYYNMKNTGRPMDPNQKYTSKYLDIPNEPLYPFGFGLSYTTFQYSEATVDKNEMDRSDSLNFRVTITNTGEVAGHEITQLYMRDVTASVTRPVKELKRFEKFFLNPGETKEIKFTLFIDDLKFYNQDLNWAAEPGIFLFGIGGDSNTALNLKVNLKQ